MTDKGKKYLSDVLRSIDFIRSFTGELESFDEYQENFLVKAAVERHLSIIGEAINKYIKETQDGSLVHAQQIISLRNRLIHAYQAIDDRIIWTIIQKHLGPLKSEVARRQE